MINNQSIAIIIPCYKVRDKIKSVITKIPEFVDNIIVVDDSCPQNSKEIVKSLYNPKIIILEHKTNQGVGGAMITGFKEALKLKIDKIIKIDGDGQMDLEKLPALINHLDNGFDYVKGNRFMHFKSLKNMPKTRLIGNSILSFFIKVASGYWFISDVANGYIAINRQSLAMLDLDKMAKRYFFESDMLIQIGIHRLNLKEVVMPSIYADEISSMNLSKVIFSFPTKILKGLTKRIFLQYFVYDFNMASVYLLFGMPMLIWGGLFGAYRWYMGITEGLINNTGIVMLAILPLILGVQFLLQAISIDMNNSPQKT